MTRRWCIAALFLAVAALGLAGTLTIRAYLASLGPLNLGEAQRASPVVLDRNAKLLRAFTMEDGRWRLAAAIDDVDPRLVTLLLAYEDHRFYAHRGVDVEALSRAALQWAWHRHVVSGGSTLTMQVARLLEPRSEKSVRAKLRQMVRAIELERHHSKTEILDLYFALAPYGGNIEGIRAASLAYFGKEPKRLSIAQAALLVALPQAPETRRPDRFPAIARAARNRVLDRAYARHVITKAERDAAMHEPVPKARRPFPTLAAHAAEEALRADPHHRVHHLTLDATWQASLEALARESAQRLGPQLSVAILVIDNRTGEIRAHIGSPDYFSAARAGAIDMTAALRSPGSALKPFIYALAFETGLAHPETMLEDRPTRYGLYAPEDFTLGYEGNVTARHALQMSLNLPAVELLSVVGPARFLARLHNAGTEIVLPKDSSPGLAVGLGGLGITLVDLTKLYAGLARGGTMPNLVERKEQEAAAKQEPLRRITEPVAAWYVADILRGAPPPENAPYGRLAFKTGTSYGYRDAFAVGFDRDDTIGVWVGRPDNGAVPGLVGRVAAAPILYDAFARISATYETLPKPLGVLTARNADLPPPLRHLRQDAPKTFAATDTAALKIVYPPSGAMIDLGLSASKSATSPLALKAQGGVPPFTWIVNGAPIGGPDPRRQSTWAPDGAGFARVSVMDAKGASASVVVRLE
ncbi:penicillin-binding protein 1C [Methylovirgula sp. HY1]|uniref:penicillin-binding protein 1C n=1 Tax=Methylovirgula sp. HY1 TaxID=2822761 RepID=UPI001C5B213C|nr:penicillin-binding protein 1C [Methylovirgula sp. HY1]QXX76412.1 Penicillin-binding protein 1C [Methylovirgula sp. HY1]